MPITLITGPANAGKAHVAIEAVRAHLARGAEPLLVVPTRADVELYRRELAGEQALLGARVQRFSDLVDEVVRRSGVHEPALGAVARERVLAVAAQRALGRDSTRAGARLVPSAQAFVAELRLRRVSPARLRQALSQWAGATAPTRALGELYGDYDNALRDMRRVDPEQRAIGALDQLRRRPALWAATPVVVYGFDDLDALQLDVIETLGAIVDAPVMVSLTFEAGRIAFAGRAATFQALAPLADEHVAPPALATYYSTAAREALSHLERSLFEDQPARVSSGEALRMLEGAGERSELQLLAREVARLIEQGMAAEDIAVVLRLDGSVADLVADVFDGAAIPFALTRRRSFADTATGRALVGLLRCAGDGGELDDLLAWLRAPGVLTRLELADALEADTRRAGAVSATAARAMWEERHWRLEALDHMRGAVQRGPRAMIERADRELSWLFCRPRLGEAALLRDDELDEARALAAGARALGELAELARRSPSLAPGDPEQLADVLRGVTLFSGPPPRPGAVAVLDPLALRARRVRALFLCRLQEGVFPAPARERALLSDEERGALAAASGLRLGAYEDAFAAERYLFYAAVSRPEQLLVLSWHTSAEDGTPRARSLFIDDVCDVFDENLAAERTERPIAQPARALGNRRPRPLTSGRAGGDLPGDLLDEQLLQSLQDHVWSASSLELWVRCPVRWFVERMLSARDLEAEAEPLARGSLAHAALKDTLQGLREQVGSARVTPATLALARELLEQALRRHEGEVQLAVTAQRSAGARRRLRADLERYLRHAASAAAQLDEDAVALEPTHLELGFGFDADEADEADDGQAQLAALDLGGGLRLRGRIDRVDVGRDGAAIVYDYKGAYVTPGAKWVSDGALQAALYMAAVEQLLDLRAVGGLYQPLRGGDLRPRGALDAEYTSQVGGYRTDLRDRDELRALLDDVVALAREAASQAGRGELRARPRTCGFGESGCVYPTICRCEQR